MSDIPLPVGELCTILILLVRILLFPFRKPGKPSLPEDLQMLFPVRFRYPDHQLPGHIHIRMVHKHISAFCILLSSYANSKNYYFYLWIV